MIINCPKCGFSQPKDRYCASCGIDIDAFRPKRPSIGRSALTHPAIYVGLAIVVVIGSVFYVRQKNADDYVKKQGYLSTSPRQIFKTLPTQVNSEAVEEVSQNSTVTAPQAALGRPLNGQTGGTVAAPTPSATSASASEQTSSSLESSSRQASHVKLVVRYLELERKTLTQFLQMRSFPNDSDDAKSGSLPLFKKLSTQFKGIIVHQKIEKTFDLIQPQPQNWFVGNKAGDPEHNIGIQIGIAVGSNDQGSINASGEILRSFRENQESTTPTKKAAEFGFELPASMSWMVHLNLPRVPQEDEDVSPSGLMSLFHSDRFLKKQDTDFTLLMEFESVGAEKDGRAPNEASN